MSKIVIHKHTTTGMGSAEQLEMHFDSELGLNDNEAGDDDEGEVATGVDREVHLPSPPPTDLKECKAKEKEKQAQAEGVWECGPFDFPF